MVGPRLANTGRWVSPETKSSLLEWLSHMVLFIRQCILAVQRAKLISSTKKDPAIMQNLSHPWYVKINKFNPRV